MSYKKCPVIFIDILGTKDNSDFDTQYKIQTMFHGALDKERAMDANHEHTAYKRFITTFSDCAYIVYDYKDGIDDCRKNDDKLFLIALYNTEKLLSYFLREGFLYRGACTFGEVYYDEEKNMLFGPAVNQVYTLEQKKAVYPRVIIDPNISEYFIKRNEEIYGAFKSNGSIIKSDADGISFIHALNTYDIGIDLMEFEFLYDTITELSSSEIFECKKKIQILDNKELIVAQENIMKKHEWVLNYLETVKCSGSHFSLEDLF